MPTTTNPRRANPRFRDRFPEAPVLTDLEAAIAERPATDAEEQAISLRVWAIADWIRTHNPRPPAVLPYAKTVYPHPRGRNGYLYGLGN
jgi:hypothetical protein